MAVREQNLDTVGAVYATFAVRQTGGVDDLTDADIGSAVNITGDYEVAPAAADTVVLGKLVDLTLRDSDPGQRWATVQIAGTMTLPIAATYPSVGDRIVGAGSGAVKQAPSLAANDPAGGNISRGTVIAVNGTIDCVVYL